MARSGAITPMKTLNGLAKPAAGHAQSLADNEQNFCPQRKRWHLSHLFSAT